MTKNNLFSTFLLLGFFGGLISSCDQLNSNNSSFNDSQVEESGIEIATPQPAVFDTAKKNTESKPFQRITGIPVPLALSFAGETVPLEQDDTKESLEYELYSNCFRHSRTSIVVKRCYRWKPMIDSILAANNVPQDFFYLAIAESELSNAARSGAGAMGMWQFMKGTGKEYGLTISNDVDERRHPIKATQAACEYLKKAYSKFGNWTLVAASYNMGKSGVAKRLERQDCESYYDLHLYTETSRYVFRILAFKLILENPEKYGFFIPEEECYKPFKYKEVTVTKTISDLSKFAKDNGTTYKDLRRFNPWFNNTSSYRLSVSKKDSVTLWLPL